MPPVSLCKDDVTIHHFSAIEEWAGCRRGSNPIQVGKLSRLGRLNLVWSGSAKPWEASEEELARFLEDNSKNNRLG